MQVLLQQLKLLMCDVQQHHITTLIAPTAAAAAPTALLPAASFSLKTYASSPGSSCCSRRWLGLARSGAGAATAAERAAVMKSAGRTGP